MKNYILLSVFLCFIFTGQSQVVIGTGTDINDQLPISASHQYSYSQSIYRSSDINFSGVITSLLFHKAGANVLNSDDWVVYIGTTSKNSFTNTADWIDVSDLNEVFNGVVSQNINGEVEVIFSTPFLYNGIDNLVIAVDENTAGTASNSDDFYSTYSATSPSLIYTSNSINPDPNNPPTGNPTNGGLKNALPNITFVGPNSDCQSSYSDIYAQQFTNYLPDCWTQMEGILGTTTPVLNATDSDWDDGNFANTGSNQCARLNMSWTNHREWLISPSFDLGTTTDYQLEFDFALTQTANTNPATIDADDIFAVVISTDNGVTWSNTNILQSWGAGDEPSNTGDHIVIDLSAHTGDIKIGLYGGSNATGNPKLFHIDNFLITEKPSCSTPVSLTSSNITEDEADLNWDSGTATNVQFQYGESGFSLGEGTLELGTASAHTLTGLTGGTAYDVYVRNICAIGDTSSWSLLESFTTLCPNVFIANYSQDFEDYLPNCWVEKEGLIGLTNTTFTSTTSNNWSPSSPGYHGVLGAASAWIVSSADSDWLISPLIDLGTVIDYQLEFDLRLCNDWDGTNEQYFFSPTDKFMVVISTDNGVTWNTGNVLQTWTAGSEPSLTGESVILDLSTYTDTVQFGFYIERTDGSTGYVRLTVDNFNVVPIPSCNQPTAVSVINILSDEVDVSWPTGGATSVELEYGLAGFTPGNGTTLVTTDNPYNLTGLSGNTEYDVYLRDICAIGDTSIRTLVNTFTTTCETYSVPYTENFASWTPGCWTEAKGRLGTSSTTFTDTESEWAADGFGNIGTTGSAFVTLNSSSKNDWLISPSIDLGTGNSYFLNFDIAMTHPYNTDPAPFHANDTVAVVISTNNGTTWSQTNILQEWLSGTEASNAGEYISIDLSSYTGIVKIGYYVGSSHYANGGNIYIDNFSIDAVPSCAQPTNLTLANTNYNSTDISWTTGGAASVAIEYGPQGFTPGTGETVVTSSNPYTISGLLDVTTYDIYIRDICGAGDTSNYSLLKQVTTTCGGYVPTYGQGFSSYLPFCWTESTQDFDGDITLTNSSNSAFTAGTYQIGNATNDGSAKFLFSQAQTHWMISPSIGLGTGTAYQLEFNIATTASNTGFPGSFDANDTLYVLISEDGGLTWQQSNILQTWTHSNQPSYTGEYVAIDLSAYSGLIKLAFYAKSVDGYQSAYIHIDDFKVLPLETCVSPVNISVGSITDVSAIINWDGTFTDSQIEYGPAGFQQGTGTLLVNTTDPLTISGLTDNTGYDFYVRKICAIGDTSDWSLVTTFTTLCPTYPPPYYNDMSLDAPYCWTKMRGNLGLVSTIVEDPIDSYWSTGWYGNVGGASISARSFITSTYHRDWLISPSIDLGTGNNYNLEFDINFTLSGAGGVGGAPLQADDTIAVVISTDNGVTWSQANILKVWDLQHQPSNATSQHISLDLSAYSGPVRLGFYNHSDVANPTTIIVSIDNFEIADCGAPINNSIDAISSTTADISWTLQTPNSTLEFGPEGYTQGTGTSLPSTTGTASITGLTSTTSYDYYIQNDCGGSGVSHWSGPFTFTTPCPEYIPTYTEDFTTYLPYCWEEKEGALGASNTTFTSTSSTTWTNDGFANIGSTGAARVNFSGTGGDDWLISPTINLGNGSTPYQVQFDVALTTWANSDLALLGADDSLSFIISTDNGLTWSSANILKTWTAGSEPTNTGDLFIKELQAYTGLVKFGFYMATTVTGGNVNMYIDNFEVKAIPSCQQPLDFTIDAITNNTVDVSWTAGASHSFIEYGLPGFTPGTGTSMLSTSASGQMTGLLPNTVYDIYVMDSCGIGDVSIWTGPITFTTECDLIIPDHLEPFNSMLPDCWSKFEGPLGTTSTLVTNPFSSLWTEDGFGNVTTTGAARLNIYSPASNGDRFNWLVSPSIDLGDGTTDYILEFDLASTYYSGTSDADFDDDDSLAILISTDDGLTWSSDNILQTWVEGDEPSSTGDHINITLWGYTGVVKLAYYGSTTGSGGNVNVYIDNFEITTCTPSASSITVLACDSYTSPSGLSYTTSGIYNDTIINAMGCDSVITIDLTFELNSSNSISTSACDEYVSDAGNSYFLSGTYTEHFTNSAGCDSTLTLYLSITSINGNVTQINGNQLISNASGGGIQYQWVDCDNGNSPISGATNSTYLATENGNYACELTKGACTELTDCYEVSNIGIGETTNNNFSLYPNPANSELTISLFIFKGESKMTITNLDGKIVHSEEINSQINQYNIDHLSKGVYVVTVSNDSGSSRLLLTVE